MLKGLVLAVFILLLALTGKQPTVKQISFLFCAALVSLISGYVLAVVMNRDFLDLLLFKDNWLYAMFPILAAYTFVLAALAASVRYYLMNKN